MAPAEAPPWNGTARCRLTRPVKGWVNLTDLVPLAGDDEEVDEEAELRYVEDFPEEFAGSDDDAAPAPALVDGGDDARSLARVIHLERQADDRYADDETQR